MFTSPFHLVTRVSRQFSRVVLLVSLLQIRSLFSVTCAPSEDLRFEYISDIGARFIDGGLLLRKLMFSVGMVISRYRCPYVCDLLATKQPTELGCLHPLSVRVANGVTHSTYLSMSLTMCLVLLQSRRSGLDQSRFIC